MEVDMPCHLGINVRFWNERTHCFHLRGEWKSSAYGKLCILHVYDRTTVIREVSIRPEKNECTYIYIRFCVFFIKKKSLR